MTAKAFSALPREPQMKKHRGRARGVGLMVAAGISLLAFVSSLNLRSAAAQSAATVTHSRACEGDNGGLALSPGFCATVFADNLGHVRHLVVAPDNTLYANTWSGRYFPNSPPPPGGFLLALRDTKGTGRADVVERFGVTVEEGGTGGSGIALYRDGLFAEENGRILRYQLHAGSKLPTGKPLAVVSGLPLTGDHPMHPFVIDREGSLYVDLDRRRTPVRRRIGFLARAAWRPAWRRRLALEPGGSTRIRPLNSSRRRRVTRAASGTARASPSTRKVVCS